MRIVGGIWGAMLVLAVFTNCGDDDDAGGAGGSQAADSGTDASGTSGAGGGGAGDAAADADASTPNATKTIGPEGGTLTHPSGAELEIPPGALAAPVEFAIVENPSDAPALSPMLQALGSVFAVTPHGTAFAQPATVRIPFDSAAVPVDLTAELHRAEQGGKYQSLASASVNGDRLEAQISSLSYFVGGVPFGYLGAIIPHDVASYPTRGAAVIGLIPGEFEVVRVNELGAVVWRRKVLGNLAFANALPRVAVGPSGNVYVASTTDKDESGTSLGGPTRLRVMGFNPSGDDRPGFPVEITLAYDNIVGDIITDSQDDIYVVGTTAPADGATHDAYRPFLASFTESGAVKDAAKIVDVGGSEPGRRIFAHSIAIAPNGSIYMNAQVVAFSVFGSGGTRVTAFDLAGNVAAGFPMKLSESSNWSKLAVDQTGIAYVVEPEPNLYAINPNGSAVNGFPQPVTLPSTGEFDLPSSGNPVFAVSSTGNLYVSGWVQNQPDNAGEADVFLQSLDSTGAQRSGFPIYVGTPETDLGDAIAVDQTNGTVWLAWHVESDPRKGFVARIPAN